MKTVAIALLTIIPTIPLETHAEGGCPPGHFPQAGQGWHTCIPGARNRPPLHRAIPQGPVWKSRWQAIATDAKVGVLGTSVDNSSDASAETTAIEDCRAKGGADCTFQISMRNGCVAMVVGESTTNFKGASSQVGAEDRAMKKCHESNERCIVNYSRCNFAIEDNE